MAAAAQEVRAPVPDRRPPEVVGCSVCHEPFGEGAVCEECHLFGEPPLEARDLIDAIRDVERGVRTWDELVADVRYYEREGKWPA